MAASTGSLKARNAAAREYARVQADVVADFAAMYYRMDHFLVGMETRVKSEVPLFTMVESYGEAANGEWAAFARSLSDRLPDRNYRSATRDMLAEFGDERPCDPCDPEDARLICDCMARLPVPRGAGMALLTRIVETIPGAIGSNAREDRTLPLGVAMVGGRAALADGRRSGGPLFSRAMHVENRDGRELVLPGFGPGQDELEGPVLPLALYDLGVTSRERCTGKGAPLALRLWIELLLSAHMDLRGVQDGPMFSMTLRELLRRLYPGRRPRPAEVWPSLVRASDVLGSFAARIPWEDPVTGIGTAGFVVKLEGFPRAPHLLDDLVIWKVNLPHGTGAGPIISPNLALYGVRSAPQYRALVSLPFHWFRPGVTRIPVGKGRRRHWVLSEDPAVYPSIDDDGVIISLCFPTSAHRQRRNLRGRAIQALHGLVDAGEVRLVEGRLMPPSWYGRNPQR